MGKGEVVQKMVLWNCIATCKGMNRNPSCTPYTKIDPQNGSKTSTTRQNYETLRRKPEKKVLNFGFDNDFLGTTLKLQVRKEKCVNQFIRFKKSCTSKDTLNGEKRHPTNSRQYLPDNRLVIINNDRVDKVLISGIHNKFLHLINTQKTP